MFISAIVAALMLLAGVSTSFAEQSIRYQAVNTSHVNRAYPTAIYVAQWSRLRHLAKLGDPEAQFELGNMYYSPPEKSGFMQSYKKAYNLFLKSAKSGNPHSQHNVAVLLLKGHGVKQDQEKALAWFLIAAENGSKNAQRIVAKFKAVEINNIAKIKSELEKNIKQKQFAK